MDPDAAYQRWRDLRDESDYEEAYYAHQDLKEWLDRGGFEPRWTAAQRRAFMGWRYRPSKTSPNPLTKMTSAEIAAAVVGVLAVVGIGYLLLKPKTAQAAVQPPQQPPAPDNGLPVYYTSPDGPSSAEIAAAALYNQGQLSTAQGGTPQPTSIPGL